MSETFAGILPRISEALRRVSMTPDMRGIGLSPLPATRFRPCSHVVGTEVLATVVLLDLASDQYVTLTAVAARMWALMAQGLSLDSVVERLCEEYEVSRSDVSRDLVTQLAEWTTRGWIEPTLDGLPRQRLEPVDLRCPRDRRLCGSVRPLLRSRDHGREDLPQGGAVWWYDCMAEPESQYEAVAI